MPSTITGIDQGENIRLEIRNNNASVNDIVLHSRLQGINSSVGLNALDVINVDDISFYRDPARTVEIVTGVDTIEAGDTIYIEATISDPFGFADITDARLTLIDPNLANQLTNVVMSQVSNTAATKTYTYTYNVPAAASIDPGLWVAQITGFEGVEGTVNHTDADSFETIAPQVDVDYTVNVKTANPSQTLTYTITITNSGAATTLDISQPVPVGTSNLNITSLPSGNASASTGTLLDIQNINAANGTTVITFTVDVSGSAQPGDLIDHTISLDNMGTAVEDIAPSVLINPFGPAAGNKLLYGDNFSGTLRFDRTVPTSNTTRSINSQNGFRTITLAPVLQSGLNLSAGNIGARLWVSRGTTSFGGQRVIQATLGYTGAVSGTIDSDSVTIQLGPGASNAQYIPFEFNLASPLSLPANTSLTLRVTNATTIAGETITIHSSQNLTNHSYIALNATSPLVIEEIEFLDNGTDSSGAPIIAAGPGDDVWVRARVSDPFGRADITGATVTITDPGSAVQVTSAAMSIPTNQPASPAERYLEYNYTLTSTLGDWEFDITAAEGLEGTVTATDSATLNVNNLSEDLNDSYKIVQNVTTMDLGATNEGDTLRYSIELVETGGLDATNVSVSDSIPANTTFVSGTLTVDGVVQADPGGGTINLSGLTVSANDTLTIEFDVTIDTPTSTGTIISNTADITHPNGSPANFQVVAEDIVITGVAAAGVKALYFEDLNSTPKLTRVRPGSAGTGDFLTINNGASQTITLSPALAGPITIDPADGAIPISLRVNANGGFSFGNVTAALSYKVGASVTGIGNVTQFAFLGNTITTNTYNIPVSALANIPAGAELQVTVTNAMSQGLRIYSFDSTNNYSTVEFDPDPVINVDEISFWSDTMGAGSIVTNPNPDNTDVDIYARIVVSDPFGDFDIQAPDAGVNPSTIVVTDPDAGVTDGGTNTSCTAPCFAYDGEDTVNDPPGNGTRTFYYLIRINSDPPSTRGTWTVQFTANEGLETGDVSHTRAAGFTTLSQPNLSTSAKIFTNTGDVDPGDTLTYEITVNNSGGQDADNVIFSDTLQTSPVALTFQSASTTCVDESATPLGNPSHSAGVVSLSNISVTGGGSCTVTINVTVGAGSPGDQINNSATITNPNGPGATAMAPTLLLSASQIPVSGAKQIYLDNVGSSRDLTRTQPNGTSTDSLTGGGDSTTLDLSFTTQREMTLQSGNIAVNLWLSNDGTGGFFGQNRLVDVELLVNANDGNGLVSIDSDQQNLALSTTSTLQNFVLNNASNLVLNAGSTFRLIITNDTAQGDRDLNVNQVSSAPFSEIVLPLTGAIEITDISFYDDSVANSGTLVDPAVVNSGDTIWVRTTISDGFGAFDVNTGCDGVTTTNCPTYTLTTPTNVTQSAIDMTYVDQPDSASRRFESEVSPGGFGLEGVWQIEIVGNEGVEGIISDTDIATFERFGQPTLTIVKSVAGTATPTSVVTFSNDVSNTGQGPAFSVMLTNEISPFLSLELVDDSGWTALLNLTAGYTVGTESFDDGDNSFTYDPNTEGVCAAPAASPCYDPAIVKWRIELNESIPVNGDILQEYRSRVD